MRVTPKGVLLGGFWTPKTLEQGPVTQGSCVPTPNLPPQPYPPPASQGHG